jgi:5-formyltetrahydrofolate cyclo-ligase
MTNDELRIKVSALRPMLFVRDFFMDKKELRHSIRSRLFGLAQSQRRHESKEACLNLIGTDEYKKASVVMIFLSLPHEVDTTAVILDAWQQGKTVAVPKISWQQRHMIAVEITSLETGLTESSSGLKNPTTGVPMPVEDIDLVVTPGLGFDSKGNRLGRGGGYYDRFFGSELLTAKKCGFAFSQQIVESVPVEEHDKLVDFLVTDAGVVVCNK